MRSLPVIVVLLAAASPAVSQEKEFVVDVNTGVITARVVSLEKAREATDARVAVLEKEVADLRAKLAASTTTPTTKTAPAVAVAADPFVPCECPAGCPSTRGISAPSAVGASTSSPASSGAVTYTLAPPVIRGGTEFGGCASGNCAAPARFRVFRR